MSNLSVPSPNALPLHNSPVTENHHPGDTPLILVALLPMLIPLGFALICVCCSYPCARSGGATARDRDEGGVVGANSGLSRRLSGVHKELIKSLPVFKLASVMGCWSNEDCVCVICLGEFEHSDELHILPKCRHTFHAECIDHWFEEHNTCPVCRQEVKEQDFEIFRCLQGSLRSNAEEMSQKMEER